MINEYKEKSRLMIDETIGELRDKPIKSTYVERLFAAEEARKLYSDLPQPLYLGQGLTYMIENVSVPVKPHDILLSRVAEWIPSDAEEARIAEISDRFHKREYFFVDGGHITLDWETVIGIGISGYIKRAESMLEKRTAEGAPKEHLDYLRGMILVYNAYRRYMLRYADAAEAVGLMHAAQASRNIADDPPKTFYEGMQLVLYITHVYSVYAAYQNATLVCGRMDDLLAALYESDLASGRITREEAGYIIDDFNCKCAIILGRGDHQLSGGAPTETGWFRNPMYDSPTYVIVGGISNRRDYRTNPLTQLFIERIHPRFENPVYVFRRTDEVDDELWTVVCDKLRQNSTLLVYNDETVIPAMINAGVEPFDANNYTIHGCNWPDIQGLDIVIGNIPCFIPNRIMDVLFDSDGNARPDITCMDDIYRNVGESFASELRDTIFPNFRRRYVTAPKTLPTWLNCTTCFTRGTIENEHEHGDSAVKYLVHYARIRYIGTAADMLAALETVVFGDDPVELQTLADALKANFAGYESLHKRLLDAPKYGRDDDRADGHAVRMMTMLLDTIDRETVNPETGKRDVMVWNVTITDMLHINVGRDLGATPDGRLAGRPVSENLSPSEGMAESVTALLNSVTKIPFDRISSGALNVRVPKNVACGEDGLARLKILLETYFENGGMQVQMNVADTAELRDAQKHPEKYRDLMVRITGYSAVFVDMCESGQNEIIRRDELAN